VCVCVCWLVGCLVAVFFLCGGGRSSLNSKRGMNLQSLKSACDVGKLWLGV